MIQITSVSSSGTFFDQLQTFLIKRELGGNLATGRNVILNQTDFLPTIGVGLALLQIPNGNMLFRRRTYVAEGSISYEDTNGARACLAPPASSGCRLARASGTPAALGSPA